MRQRQHSHVAVPALGHFESVSELNVETPETKAVSRRLYRHRAGVGRVGDLRQSTPEMPRTFGGSEVLRQWRENQRGLAEKNCHAKCINSSMRTSLHRRTSTLSWTHSPEVFGEAQKAGQGHVNVHAWSAGRAFFV